MAETEEKAVGAPVAPVEEAETPIEAPPVKLPDPPYTKETLTEISKFFRGRAKNPELYSYAPDGNLDIKEGAAKGKKKVVAGSILLQNFVPLDPAERVLLEETRLEQLVDLDTEYEEEAVILRQAWEEYRTTQSMRAVLNSNQRMTEIDARRSAVRAQVRDLVDIPNPTINTILLADRYEERKMFSHDDPYNKNIVRMCFYPFPAEVELGKYVPDAKVEGELKEAEEEAGADKASEILYRQRLKDGRFARIFFEADSDVNGFLSPMWPVDFTLNVGGIDSRYSSAIQAYEVERARELGNAALVTSLMKTRSPRTIRLLTRQQKGHPKDAKGLWLKIYSVIYDIYPNLKAKLLATGSDTLVFADLREGPSSIGLAEKDSGTLDPAKWKGENAVGLAQETVRTALREGTQQEAGEAPTVKHSVITEEEQKKAKVGAIIHSKR